MPKNIKYISKMLENENENESENENENESEKFDLTFEKEGVNNDNKPISKNNYFNIICKYTKKILLIITRAIILVIKVLGIYILWIFLHYFSSHLYIKFCVPNTLLGFVMSPLMISTPHCQGLRWIVYNAAGVINNMWIFIGGWIYSVIWIFNNNNNDSLHS
jgi:hypothetical protein